MYLNTAMSSFNIHLQPNRKFASIYWKEQQQPEAKLK